jgi:hypothetical protein
MIPRRQYSLSVFRAILKPTILPSSSRYFFTNQHHHMKETNVENYLASIESLLLGINQSSSPQHDDSSQQLSFIQQSLIELFHKDEMSLQQRLHVYEFSRKHSLLSLAERQNMLHTAEFKRHALATMSDEDFSHYITHIFHRIDEKSEQAEIVYLLLQEFIHGGNNSRVTLLYEIAMKKRVQFSAMQLYNLINLTFIKMETFSDKLIADIEPSKVQFSNEQLEHLIQRATGHSRTASAHNLFRMVLHDGTRLSEVTYAYLFRCFKRDDTSSYSKFILDLESHLEKHQIFTEYIVLAAISALGERGHEKLAMKWFNYAVNAKVSLRTCLTGVVKAMANNNHIDKALEFIRKVQKEHGVIPTDGCFNVLLHKCRPTDIEQINKIIRDMEELMPLTIVAYSILLSFCQDVNEFTELLQKMEQNTSIEWNTIAYNNIISTLVKMGCRKNALLYYERIKQLNYKFDSLTIVPLVIAFKDDERIVNKLWIDCWTTKIYVNPFLAILFTQFSRIYRDFLLKKLACDTDTVKVIDKKYPYLFSTLVYVLKEKNAYTSMKYTQRLLTKHGIEVTLVDPKSIRIVHEGGFIKYASHIV